MSFEEKKTVLILCIFDVLKSLKKSGMHFNIFKLLARKKKSNQLLKKN